MSLIEEEVRISVIVPSYNQGRFIENCILSVLHQKYSNWELIIQDGGSTDKTQEICERYSMVCDKISYISEKDSGFADAVNKALLKASGTLCVIQSADDFFSTNSVFEDVCKIYNNNESLWIIAGASLVTNEGLELLQTQERVTKYVPNENIFCLKDHFSQGATFFSLNRAKEVNFLFDTVEMVADTHFWIKMACWSPVGFNKIYQTSNIWGGVTVQPEQRSSDLSRFYLGRAEMALLNVFNQQIEYSDSFKKQVANSLIDEGIKHFIALNLNYERLQLMFKRLNGIEYIPQKFSFNRKLKNIIKKYIFQNEIRKETRINSRAEWFLEDNAPRNSVKWF